MIIKNYFKYLESIKTIDMWDIIPNSVKELHKLFKDSNKKLYLVGGSVRDFTKGDDPKDFDLATDALPDEVLEIIGNKYRTNLQGKAFGVVVVYTKEIPEGMEIATFRSDVSKGRNPEVELGVTIEDDVLRRDTTYNALFYDLDKKEIIDLTGGLDDLNKGITRMVGDPHERFEEDSLRILRAFRFASRYKHTLHKDTSTAIKNRNQLQNIDIDTNEFKRISQERIWEEIEKSWKQVSDFNFYLNLFTEYDMWDQIFPGSKINTKLVDSKNIFIVFANLFVNDSNNLYRRLVHDYKIPDSSESGKLASKIVFLVSLLSFEKDDVFSMYKKRQQISISDSVLLEWLKVNNIDDVVLNKFVEYRPSVSSKELIDSGFTGADLGREIKRLEIESFNNML